MLVLVLVSVSVSVSVLVSVFEFRLGLGDPTPNNNCALLTSPAAKLNRNDKKLWHGMAQAQARPCAYSQ